MLTCVALVYQIIDLYIYVVIGAMIASWVAPGSNHPIVVLLNRLTEPVFEKIRNILPDLGAIDISPMIVIFGLNALKGIL